MRARWAAARSLRAESSATLTVLSQTWPRWAGESLEAPSHGARSTAGWRRLNGGAEIRRRSAGRVVSARAESACPANSRGSVARQIRATTERARLAQSNDILGLRVVDRGI